MCSACSAASSRDVRGQIVAETKKLPASALDPSQPSVPLEQWLKTALGPGTNLDWQIGDCDLKPDFSQPAQTYPTCVMVRSMQPNGVGRKLHILVGTIGHPSLSGAAVEPQSFMWRSCPGTKQPPKFVGVRSLSEISTRVSQLSANQYCQ